MSVVIGIKYEGKVYMAADTMVTFGDSKRYLRNPDAQKIWAVEDTPNCIMGGAGYLRDISLIRHCTSHLVPELNILKNEINVGTLMLYTAPQIAETIAAYNEAMGTQKREETSSVFLWAYKDRLFSIWNDGEVEEFDDYTAIGSGADAAIASLMHTEGEPIEDRLSKALDAAAEISLYVDAPYLAIDTETTEYYELYSAVSEEQIEEELVNALTMIEPKSLEKLVAEARSRRAENEKTDD